MVKIVLFALILHLISGKISVANASSGFYISAASLISRVDVSRNKEIKAGDVTFATNKKDSNGKDLDFLTNDDLEKDKNTERAFQFNNAKFSFEEWECNDKYVEKDIDFKLYAGNDKITHSPKSIGIISRTDNDEDFHNYDNIKITPNNYKAEIAEVKTMIAPLFNNKTFNNGGGFELSTGYKF